MKPWIKSCPEQCYNKLCRPQAAWEKVRWKKKNTAQTWSEAKTPKFEQERWKWFTSTRSPARVVGLNSAFNRSPTATTRGHDTTNSFTPHSQIRLVGLQINWDLRLSDLHCWYIPPVNLSETSRDEMYNLCWRVNVGAGSFVRENTLLLKKKKGEDLVPVPVRDDKLCQNVALARFCNENMKQKRFTEW